MQSEMMRVLRLIYQSEKSQKVLIETSKKKHIIDQWTYMRNRIAFFSELKYNIVFRFAAKGYRGYTNTKLGQSQIA